MKAKRLDINVELEVREIPQDELDYTQKPFCPRCDSKANHYECEEESSIYCPSDLQLLTNE